jgi:hypothetical protein
LKRGNQRCPGDAEEDDPNWVEARGVRPVCQPRQASDDIECRRKIAEKVLMTGNLRQRMKPGRASLPSPTVAPGQRAQGLPGAFVVTAGIGGTGAKAFKGRPTLSCLFKSL